MKEIKAVEMINEPKSLSVSPERIAIRRLPVSSIADIINTLSDDPTYVSVPRTRPEAVPDNRVILSGRRASCKECPFRYGEMSDACASDQRGFSQIDILKHGCPSDGKGPANEAT